MVSVVVVVMVYDVMVGVLDVGVGDGVVVVVVWSVVLRYEVFVVVDCEIEDSNARAR